MIEKIIIFIINFIINEMKFYIKKIFHPFNFKFNFFNKCSFFTDIKIRDKGKIIIKKNVKTEKNTIISSLNNGFILLGENSFINRNCYVVSHKKILIGKNVIIGPNTTIVDHDHMILNGKIEYKKFVCKEITIGDNCWIGSNVIILKGSKIGNNCIIAAGSVVNGEVPNNSIYIQKRNKELKKVDR